MKTQETIIKVLNKDTKTGNTNGRDWTIDEYTVVEEIEKEDGSIVETKLKVQTTGNVGELKVGVSYKVIMLITSRETEYNGKKSIWNTFRVTRADLVGEAKEEEPVEVLEIDDSMPF